MDRQGRDQGGKAFIQHRNGDHPDFPNRKRYREVMQCLRRPRRCTGPSPARCGCITDYPGKLADRKASGQQGLNLVPFHQIFIRLLAACNTPFPYRLLHFMVELGTDKASGNLLACESDSTGPTTVFQIRSSNCAIHQYRRVNYSLQVYSDGNRRCNPRQRMNRT